MHSTALISGPYSPLPKTKTSKHISIARECALWLWSNHYYAICPHLNTANFEHEIAVQNHVYVDFCFKLMRSGVVDLVVMLPNWNQSHGAKLEFKLARELYIPLYIWTKTTGIARIDNYI